MDKHERWKPLTDLIGGRRWLPAVVWAGAILTVSSLPRMDFAPRLFPGCDKVLHFIEYSILGMGLRYWSGGWKPFFTLGGAGFAALDEFHQKFVPGRHASIFDWVADLCGMVVGSIMYGFFMKKRNDG
jgi:VanZ family protein